MKGVPAQPGQKPQPVPPANQQAGQGIFPDSHRGFFTPQYDRLRQGNNQGARLKREAKGRPEPFHPGTVPGSDNHTAALQGRLGRCPADSHQPGQHLQNLLQVWSNQPRQAGRITGLQMPGLRAGNRPGPERGHQHSQQGPKGPAGRESPCRPTRGDDNSRTDPTGIVLYVIP